MLLFILAFLTLYGGLNGYIYYTVVSALSLVASLYGFIESRRIRVRFLEVQSPKFGYEDTKSFRVVQISDLHLGYGTLLGQVRHFETYVRSR